MHRPLIIALVGLAGTATPAAATPAAATVPPDAAHARLVACHTGFGAPARYLTAEASMSSLHAGDRMQLRFELYRRASLAGPTVRVGGPGLGSWNDATAGVARFRFRKTIANLPARALYRVLVRYRWLDAAGATLARAVRRTPWCAQPDPRPDLRVASLNVAPGPGPGTRTYRVLVHNAGRSAAAGFGVQVTVDGERQPAATVPVLAAGASRTVSIVGPRCAEGGSLAVVVDPDNRVDESSESDDRVTFPCP